MEHDKIIVRGAKEHNLKNVNVEIPRNKLVVITGLSGSGKSSLAFDIHLCRGTKTLCRKPFFLCKNVFGTNGQTECREH